MKSKKIKVAVLQYQIDSAQPEKNVKKSLKLIQEISLKNPDLILLPEICIGAPLSKKWRYFYMLQYKLFLEALCLIAKQNKICFYGSFLEEMNPALSPISQEAKKFFNSALFINQSGKIINRYNKIHLFALDGENKRFEAGKSSQVFTSPFGKVAPLICYDIRFPELLRKQTFAGAELALVCAQWPSSRRDHWTTLLKARAIENQIFVVACNRTGTKGNLSYSGDSCVISPWGEILLQLNEQKDYGICDINLSEIARIRKKFPFLKSALKDKFSFRV